MIDLQDPRELKALQGNIIAVFDTPQGKEVMAFLEQSCGWYESVFDPQSEHMTYINAGRREVVATIKTFLKYSPDQLAAVLAQPKEQNHG